MKALNLISDAWIPVRRRDGTRDTIAPWQLTEAHDTNPIISLDVPRADFNGAMVQFLIGLLQTTAAPGGSEGIDWEQWLEEAPPPDRLKELFLPYADYFNLGGDGPRFMQDFHPLDDDPKPISALLIDAPGAQTLRQNADHFIKRGGVNGLCPACTALALFTLQTNAPSGGAGHRTSLRGGGPLTTLVVLDPDGSELEPSLWRDLWLNVLPKDQVSRLTGNPKLKLPEAVFPWTGPTRTSAKGGQDTYPEDAHPLQMYWGMPRRIRLLLEESAQGECDICSCAETRVITHYRTKNYGVNYSGPWEHPLSPHYRDEKTGAPMPYHAQPGGFNYRNWFTWTSDSENRMQARVIKRFSELRLEGEQPRVWAFGFDMDNAKARAWYEAIAPLYVTPAGEPREQFISEVQRLVDAATQAAAYVQGAVKEAWFKRPGDVRGDTSFIKEVFFDRTADGFYSLVGKIHKAVMDDSDPAVFRADWLQMLQRHGERLFDERAANGAMDAGDIARLARAQIDLKKKLRGKKLRVTILELPPSSKESKA